MLLCKILLTQLKRRLHVATAMQRSGIRRASAFGVDLLEPRQLLAATPVGVEFQVNSTTVGDQTTNARGQGGSVAMDADGDFVVVWKNEPDQGIAKVTAQRYDAAGTKRDGEFQVNTVEVPWGELSSVAVAMDSDGDFVVTWSSYYQDAFSGWGVYAREYNAAGVPETGEVGVNTHSADDHRYPSVAMDAHGDFVVTWSSDSYEGVGQDGEGSGVFARRYQVNSQATLCNNALILTGTPQQDAIVVTEGAVLTVTINNDVYTFSPTQVAAILIDGLPENDSITINSLAQGTTPTANGNSGNDTLVVRTSVKAPTVLIGGIGNVSISGGGGGDTLMGGAGNNFYRFDTDLALGSDTIIDAGGEIDTLDFHATMTRAVNMKLGNAAAQLVNAGLTLTLSANNTIENVIGGSLGDTLTGNGLANVLSGGAGNDALNGGAGKDILIDGIGADTLTRGSGQDLLIGAQSTRETSPAALLALQSEWTSASSYGNRVAYLLGTLAGGANGNYKLTSANVNEDNVKDTLTGGTGKD